ncbi:hypothetical protein [Abyssibacter sp.]|jgi:hypothetical protein|uniref:hypothetical protein n=1 Tax=Abyssibacter sp. TaxID=2320200 RepID=UPI003517095E
MIQEKSSEVAKRFGDFAQQAQHEPVEVTQYGRAHVVILSAREHARLRRLDRQVFATNEIPNSLVSAIKDAQPSAEAAQYNDEV